MKKLLSILTVAAIICSLSFAQAFAAMDSKSGDMKNDKAMMDGGMKKDGAMKKDGMMGDDMKKDGMMKDDGMKKDKGMMKDDKKKM